MERALSANFWPLMITLVLQYIHIERNMFGSLEYHEFFSACMWCFRCDDWWSSHFQWNRNSLLQYVANHPFLQFISWMKHLWFNIFFDQVGWFDLSNMAIKSLIPCLINRWNCNMGNHPWIYVWIRLSLGKSTWFRRSKKSNKGFSLK